MSSIARNSLLSIAAVIFLLAVPNHSHSNAKAAEQWRPLFNGKNLDGWKHVGPGEDTVEDGLIRTHGGMGLLYWTKEKFGNCRIQASSTRCATTTTTPASSSAFPSSRASHGCPSTTATKSRSTISPKIRRKTNITSPARFIRSPSRSPGPASLVPNGTRW